MNGAEASAFPRTVSSRKAGSMTLDPVPKALPALGRSWWMYDIKLATLRN